MAAFEDIFEALKEMFEADDDLRDLRIYAGEDPRKPKLPCVVFFPRRRTTVKREGVGTRRHLPRKVWYEFDILLSVDVKQRERLLFGEGSITDWADKIETVLKSDATIGGTVFDADWTDVMFEFRPGFLAIAIITYRCRKTELE